MNQDINTLIRLSCIKFLGGSSAIYEKMNINDLIVIALKKYVDGV